MAIRILVQSVLTAVIIVASGFGVWSGIVQPQLEARESRLSTEARQERQALQAAVEAARRDKASIDAELTALRQSRTALQSEQGRLEEGVKNFRSGNADILGNKSVLDRQIAELTQQLTVSRAEKATLEIESKVLVAEADDLTKQSDTLRSRIRRLSKSNSQTLVRNKELKEEAAKLTKEANRLRLRVASQRTAVVDINKDMLATAKALQAERKKLSEISQKMNGFRDDLATGLTSVAKEFKKIANRNVGLVKQRYNVLADDKQLEIEEINKKAAPLKLGADVAASVVGKIENAISTAPLIGKIVNVIYCRQNSKTAFQIRDLLAARGLAVTAQTAAEQELENQKPGISYFGGQNKDVAVQIQSILLDAEISDFDSRIDTGSASVDFIIWVIGEAAEPDATSASSEIPPPASDNPNQGQDDLDPKNSDNGADEKPPAPG